MSRRTTTVAALAALTLTLAAPALAAEAPERAEPGAMALVLDASGSMAEPVGGGGGARIDAAKESLRSVVDSLPAEQEVSFRVFGSSDVAEDDPAACRDSEQVVQRGTDNRDDLLAAIEDYEPVGWTPTGHALREAAKDLGDEGQRTIVLVSDGESTCDPDPCEVARDLAQDGIDLKVDVVGLDVDGAAREQLQCTAEAGNGTYYDADSAEELTDSLTTSSTRASRPFDLTGAPVRGATTPEQAPAIGQGVHLDAFGEDDGLWYRIARTVPGSTIHAGVTHFSEGTGNSGDKARITLTAGPEESRCDQRSSFARGNIAYTATSSWQADAEHPCSTAEVVHLQVAYMSSDRLVGEPVEIAVYEEPPLEEPTEPLPPRPQEPRWGTIEPGTATDDVVPGTSISNAPVVADGSYDLDLNPGETQVLAVPLDWGQNLQAQLDGTITDAHREGAFDAPWVQVLGPVRQIVDTDVYGVDTKPEDFTRFQPLLPADMTDYRTGSQSFTVGYPNRAEIEQPIAGSALPGLRYVQVSYSERNDAPLDYTLTLRTNGTAGEGAPRYADAEGLVAPTADSPLVRATAVQEAPTDEEPVAEDASDSSLPWFSLVLAAVLLVVVVTGLLLVLRRRRTR